MTYEQFKSVINFAHNDNVATGLNDAEMRQEYAIWKQDQVNKNDICQNVVVRTFKCERCGAIYTSNSGDVGCCVAPCDYRTGYICGGALTEVFV